jgi:hypothetical protein
MALLNPALILAITFCLSPVGSYSLSPQIGNGNAELIAL